MFKHVVLAQRDASEVAVCSYSVNKYLSECIKTHHFDIKNTIFREGHSPLPDPTSLGAFGTRPPVPLSDGLDTRPRKILDPRSDPHTLVGYVWAYNVTTQVWPPVGFA